MLGCLRYISFLAKRKTCWNAPSHKSSWVLNPGDFLQTATGAMHQSNRESTKIDDWCHMTPWPTSWSTPWLTKIAISGHLRTLVMFFSGIKSFSSLGPIFNDKRWLSRCQGYSRLVKVNLMSPSGKRSVFDLTPSSPPFQPTCRQTPDVSNAK